MNDTVKTLEPVVILLFLATIFFTIILIFVDWKFHEDGQIFQVVASLVTGFAGALLSRIKPAKHDDKDATEPAAKGE